MLAPDAWAELTQAFFAAIVAIVAAFLMAGVIFGIYWLRTPRRMLDEARAVQFGLIRESDSVEGANVPTYIIERRYSDEVKRIREEEKFRERDRRLRLPTYFRSKIDMRRIHGHYDESGLWDALLTGAPFDEKPCTLCGLPRFRKCDPEISDR